jgi:hypothetical protein
MPENQMINVLQVIGRDPVSDWLIATFRSETGVVRSSTKISPYLIPYQAHKPCMENRLILDVQLVKPLP